MSSPSICISIPEAVAGAGQFVHNYQTLIAGLVAIAAAYITARPVWHQLERMSVQTNTMFRDFLLDRLQAQNRFRGWLWKRLEPFRNDVSQRMYEMREDEGRLNVHWVFDRAQVTRDLVSTLEQFRSERRDTQQISAALDEVIASLTALEKALHTIHRPASTDQSGEDYAYSDEKWAEIGREAEAADGALDGLVGQFKAAMDRLDKAIQRELGHLRDRLRKTDDALLAEQG
ncbi:MAG: hypothetical protein JWP50_1881 [Phenylobacterium sp.]|nr:hypothetical protein [Phenylobacterium sp.]